MAREKRLDKIWNSLNPLFSVVFIVGLQQAQRRNLTFLQFALWQQPAGLSCAIPTCVPGCSTHEVNRYFPRSKCSALPWQTMGFSKITQHVLHNFFVGTDYNTGSASGFWDRTNSYTLIALCSVQSLKEFLKCSLLPTTFIDALCCGLNLVSNQAPHSCSLTPRRDGGGMGKLTENMWWR